MASPDQPPFLPSPERPPAFDRAVTNIQDILYSSERTRMPDGEDYGEGMTRSVTFGVHGVSEHMGEDGQPRYRASTTTGDSVWVFDPDTRTVHQGSEDPSFDLELTETREVDEGVYAPLTDKLPELFADAKASNRVGYPRSATAAFLGRLTFRRKH